MGALNEIFGYLIQTLLSLYLVAMLLRFLLQLVRADFYNPICQFLVKITNPLVIPLRRVVPGFAGIDMASLLLALLLQLAGIVGLLLINGLGLPNILFCWCGRAGRRRPAGEYLLFCPAGHDHPQLGGTGQQPPGYLPAVPDHRAGNGALSQSAAAMGGMDFSPILVFILINVIQIALRHMAAGVGLHPALVIGCERRSEPR